MPINRHPEGIISDKAFGGPKKVFPRAAYFMEIPLRGPLIAFSASYLLWVSFSALTLEAGKALPAGGTHPSILVPVFLVVFLILASLITAVHLIYAEPALKRRPGLRAGFLLLTVGVAVGLYFGVRITGISHPILFMIATANLLVFANLLGAWIVAPIQRPAELLPLCLIMSLADLFSVAGGPTKKIAETLDTYYKSGMKGPAPIADFIIIKIAAPGLDRLVPVFGLADWVIVAFLCAASARFGMNDNLAGKSMEAMVRERRPAPYLPVAVAGLLLAMGFAHYSGLFLPALPVVAFCYLLYGGIIYPPLRRPRRSDWKLMLITLLLMGGLLAARYWLI